ncbi:MAG: PQQ-binding-like beta-propeller repeat protein [Actinomycetales bacterium]|nr:PQQ-binding-like beta-propeller repeat protein [Actinomycetales bacterium]
MRLRGRKAEVELVELGSGAGHASAAVEEPALLDDELADDGESSDPERGADRPRGWRRVRRAWPVALLAVVVGGAYLVKAAREQAALAATHELLAGQEAFVADLGRVPGFLWRVDAPEYWASPSSAGDVVLLQRAKESGESVSVALDRETGAELWRAEPQDDALSVYCGLPSETFAAPAGMVACVEQRRTSGDEVESIVLQQRDARTGEVRSSRDVPTVGFGVAPWRSDLLQVEMADSETSLRLVDAEGATVWTLPLLDRALGSDSWVNLQVWEDRAVVSASDRALVIEHDGQIVVEVTPAAWGAAAARARPEGGQPEVFVTPLLGGGYVFSYWASSHPEKLVFDEGGDAVYEIEGDPQVIGLDDGSAGRLDAWNAAGGGLDLVDSTTGELAQHLGRWQYGSVYLLDGKAVLGGGGRLRAVDLTTGEDVWAEISGGDLVASDGAVVVVHERNVELSWLRALDLESGREVWRLDLVSPEAVAFAIDGALYVHDDGTFARLGR